MLAEQLAIPPEDTAHLTLAAALHVLPAAFPETEDGAGDTCEFSASSLLAAGSALRRIAPPEVASLAGEACERWDGSGLPNRLLGEEATIGGRVLAAVCAFDHASAAGLEPGLDVVRTASGTAFDPVVVAELIHLFRQPWQQRQAA
jgi:HD-GYP domain-containing protein (c-di-GMP phosphodiesterase class II)